MFCKVYDMKEKGSLPGAGLTVYIQDDSQELMLREKPMVLICPGGGYSFISEREAEGIALQFLAMGCHAAVLRYSCVPARFPTALFELARSVKLIRENARKWHVDEARVILLGCSAGGHLAASLGVFWTESFVAEGIGLAPEQKELLRPNGQILCYPVITSGEFAHRDSFRNLLGGRLEELSEKMSLEKWVNGDTPRTFIWHTFEDRAVPAENSLLFVTALRKAGISTEFHLYPKGGHGLSLASRLTSHPGGCDIVEECQSWIELARAWLELDQNQE